MPPPTFDALPTELHVEISSYLDFYDLHMLRATSRQMRGLIRPLLTLDAPITLSKLEAAATAYTSAMNAAWVAHRTATNGIAFVAYGEHYTYEIILRKRPAALAACGQCCKLRPDMKVASATLRRVAEKRFCIDCGTQPLGVGPRGAKSKSAKVHYPVGTRTNIGRSCRSVVLCARCGTWSNAQRERPSKDVDLCMECGKKKRRDIRAGEKEKKKNPS